MHEIEGIPVDPELPKGFDDTPNDERPPEHDEWWHRPYIVSDRFEPTPFETYAERCALTGSEPQYTPEQWSEDQAERGRRWLEAWPSGVRYNVRCLDGGAWDRSTNYGMFGDLDEAVSRAKDVDK